MYFIFILKLEGEDLDWLSLMIYNCDSILIECDLSSDPSE